MKKILSIILSLTLIINFLPVNMIFAEEKTIEEHENTISDEIITVEDEDIQPTVTTTSELLELTPEELDEMPKLPQAYILAAEYKFFSELEESDKQEVANYLNKEEKALEDFEKEGYTLIQSINIITLSQESIFSENDIKQLLKINNNISEVTEKIKIFEESIKYISIEKK